MISSLFLLLAAAALTGVLLLSAASEGRAQLLIIWSSGDVSREEAGEQGAETVMDFSSSDMFMGLPAEVLALLQALPPPLLAAVAAAVAAATAAAAAFPGESDLLLLFIFARVICLSMVSRKWLYCWRDS